MDTALKASTPPECCSWCIKEFGWPLGAPGTSHGICPRHREQLLASLDALAPRPADFDLESALQGPAVPERYVHRLRGTWSLSPEGLVDVEGNVLLNSLGLTELPIRFGHVTGDFYCLNNQLQSLAGAPQTVGGNFDCSDNRLQSLEGAPQSVGGDFDCYNNHPLQSLAGAPQTVGGNFDCSDNRLQSLEGAPQSVGGCFNCDPETPGQADCVRRLRRV